MSRPNRKVNTIQDLQIIMQGMFSRINEHFFNNELEKVVITFEAGFKKGAFGWINTVKDWKQGQTERYNINISADYLDRSREQIISTLIHEMCHLYALQNDIKDTSRSGIFCLLYGSFSLCCFFTLYRFRKLRICFRELFVRSFVEFMSVSLSRAAAVSSRSSTALSRSSSSRALDFSFKLSTFSFDFVFRPSRTLHHNHLYTSCLFRC